MAMPIVEKPLTAEAAARRAGVAAGLVALGRGAGAAGLIAWYATRVELLGPGAPGWLPAAIVAGAAVALPTLTSLCVLFSEPLFSVLLALAIILADRPPSRWSPETGATLAGV